MASVTYLQLEDRRGCVPLLLLPLLDVLHHGSEHPDVLAGAGVVVKLLALGAAANHGPRRQRELDSRQVAAAAGAELQLAAAAAAAPWAAAARMAKDQRLR